VTPGAILPDRGVGATVLAVADCVGPTFQGQGPSAGQVAMVIRLAGDTLACPAGEGPPTGDRSHVDPTLYRRRFSVDQLASWVLGSSAQLVVISGGEPLRQQAQLVPVVRCLAGAGRWVEIDTHGTCVPDPALVAVTGLFVVSPRLSRSAVQLGSGQRIHPAVLAAFVDCDRAVFTFAVGHPDELDEIAELEQRFTLHPIWVMPAASTDAAVLDGLAWLAEAALLRGWHVSTRLPAVVRGDWRGQ
jgi:7-carboxy-7-deazaguanine synthase